MTLPTPRRARAARAAQRWAEANRHADLALLAQLEEATADASDAAGRDLTAPEVAAGCCAVIDAIARERRQREAEEQSKATRAEELEAARLAYLARQVARMRGEPEPAPLDRPTLALDDAGKRTARRVIASPGPTWQIFEQDPPPETK